MTRADLAQGKNLHINASGTVFIVDVVFVFFQERHRLPDIGALGRQAGCLKGKVENLVRS